MQYENIIKIIFIISTVIFVTVLVVKRFIYFHPSNDFITSQENYQDISDGSLHGWLIQGEKNDESPEASDKAILFCHGNDGNISYRSRKINALNSFGYTVIIFDYSGYGKSTGIPSEKQCYHDASIFTNILLKTYNKNKIILYGESIGAPIASYISRRYGIQTLILESPLPSIKSYINHKIPFLSILSIFFPEFNTEEYLFGLNSNILLLHSIEDEVIPYNSINKLKIMSTQSIDMTGVHNQVVIPWEDIHQFISTYCI